MNLNHKRCKKHLYLADEETVRKNHTQVYTALANTIQLVLWFLHKWQLKTFAEIKRNKYMNAHNYDFSAKPTGGAACRNQQNYFQ